MQTRTEIYKTVMASPVRPPSSMRVTFHYPSGGVTYTDSDIVKVTEKKSAHLIAGEIPTIDLSIQLKNLDGSFSPNDVSGLHDMIVAGVRVTYEYGLKIPIIYPYGYTGEEGETYDPVYGLQDSGVPQFYYPDGEGSFEVVPAEAYGYFSHFETEWLDGGEVWTDGDISYDTTTATITAKDYLSLIDTPIYLTHSTRTLAQIATLVINSTEYPEDISGAKKIVLGSELDAISSNIVLAENSDNAMLPKEWLQTIAHFAGVKFYIDRLGYIHLDNTPETLSSSEYYELTLNQQKENPVHTKLRMPKSVTVNLATEYGDPVFTDLDGGGEAMTVDNPYIILTADGERVSSIVLSKFIPYRNEAQIAYRGEPALDILDPLYLTTDFQSEVVTGIIINSELTFDGTLSGSLTVRYNLGANSPASVYISGGNNFTFPLATEEPTVTSYDLVCTTDGFTSPTYQWQYFVSSVGTWQDIANVTNSLTVAYDDTYYASDDSVKFRCVVTEGSLIKAGLIVISKIFLTKSAEASYRGIEVVSDPSEIAVEEPKVGDIVLMDNTTDETAEVYGESYVYDGEEWVATEESDDLALTYKDALALAVSSERTIYSAKIYTDLLVANEAFIDTLTVRKLEASTDNYTVNIDEDNGIKFVHTGETIFHARQVIDTPKVTIRNADVVGTLKTGGNTATDARVAIRDQTGVLAPPVFTGTGLDDLSIADEGDVTGDFRVEITDTDSDALHNEEYYWKPFTVPAGGALYGIAVNSEDRFVGVATDYINYSDDGVSWSSVSLSGNWKAVTVNSSDRFVAVGTDKFAYSDDGENWTTVALTGLWTGVTVSSSGRFVAVASGRNAYSDDGVSWSSLTNLYNLIAVTVNSSGRFVGVGFECRGYSDDGINWTVGTLSGSHVIYYGVTVNASGRFVAVGIGTNILYSDDGNTSTWYSSGAGSGFDLRAVTVNSSGRFVAVGGSRSTTDVFYSDDGSSWTGVTNPFDLPFGGYWYAVAVNSSGKFVSSYMYTPLADIFKWTGNALDTTPTWHTDIPIPNSKTYNLNDGIDYKVIIQFGNQEGHTVGNYWTFTQSVMRSLSAQDTDGLEYFSVSNGVVDAKNLSLDGMSMYACRAWANSNNGSMRLGQGISSTQRLGTGFYRFNFSTPMPDTDYAVVALARDVNTNDSNALASFRAGDEKTTTYFNLVVTYDGYYDSTEINVIVMR